MLIADGEPLARRRLREVLSRDPDAEVVAECADGDEAVRRIRRDHPDLVFLKVGMPGLDGFAVLERVGAERMPLVVFVAADPGHALRAFEFEALDYLLAPVEPHRLRRAVERALEARPAEGPGWAVDPRLISLLEELGAEQRQLERLLTGAEERYAERMMVKAKGRVVFVRTEEIDWVEAEGNYVRLHVGAAGHLVRETMSAMEERLDPRRFARVHRSSIVNLDRVRELRPWFAGDYQVVLLDGTELRLSRSYRARLEARLA